MDQEGCLFLEVDVWGLELRYSADEADCNQVLKRIVNQLFEYHVLLRWDAIDLRLARQRQWLRLLGDLYDLV